MIFDMLQRSEPLENPATPLSNFDDFGSETVAGERVTEGNAWKLAPVYSCIYILSSTLAQLPLNVMRRTGGKVEAAKDHPAYHLLHNEPNEWCSSYDWREVKQAQVLGWGNGFTEIIRNHRGEISSLEQRMSASMGLVDVGGGRQVFGASDGLGKARPISPEDMIHIRAIGSTGRWGTSPVRQHAESIGLGLAVQRYGAAFFGSGGKPSGFVTVKNQLNEDGWDRLKKVWKEIQAKLKSGESRNVLLPGDLDYHSITVPPNEAQFLETQKYNRSVTAGIYNVPSHMINDLEKATFSNISEQAIHFVRHSMMPWVVKWEQELNRKLFSVAERNAGYYVKFNLAGLLRGTPKERAAFYHYAITDGWMHRNEARAFEDMNPEAGLDEFLVSVNAANVAKDKKDDGDE